jgi:hypothetical protein
MDIVISLALVAGSVGIVAVAGGLFWCWVKLAPRIRRLYY